MTDYKKTLNLPQTNFPMKANLPQREPMILKQWQRIDLYGQLQRRGKDKPKFVLLDGPPYANGHIHVGHAVNKILKDIVLKSKIFSGFNAPYVPGWDCHGLPIELNVEKKHGKPGKKISAAQFRAACRDYAQSQVTIQSEEFQRLGVIGDWGNPYLTMNYCYEANIIRSLAKLMDNKHVQKGYKPVHWCLDCGSALAEAEVEYVDKTSPSIDVRFIVCDAKAFKKRFAEIDDVNSQIAVPIWTTTPWTLPANQAVALNPSLEYLLVKCDSYEQLLIAESLLSSVLQRYNIQQHRILGHVLGAELEGIELKHPFYDRKVPIVLGDHVTVEAGTGAVHTAPAHGQDDYVIAKQYHLPLDNPIGDDGIFIDSTPIFAGIYVTKVNEKIIEELIAHAALIHQTTVRHSYPHCWRHKTPIIFRATPQWFISMDKNQLRQMALQAIDRIEWLPDWGRSRIRSMIENRPDWCISRQRAWGVPLPFFINKETGELHPRTIELMEQVAQAVEKEGIEAWFSLEIRKLLSDEAKDYQKSIDVLDVWFDSGVIHECVLRKRPELSFPADLVLEGSDQHRGWFQSQLLTSVGINGHESYKMALTHGFVVDGQGRKMSKSMGNVIAPHEVIKTLGADILRLWVASIDYRTEIAASNEILTRISETYRRVRNTARFFLANLHDFNPDLHLVESKKMLVLDRLAVDSANRLQKEIQVAYDSYQFHLVVQKLHHFCVNEMGGFYLDIIKDRQYTMAKESLGRRSAQTALFHIAQAFVRWIAPIMSFTAEEIWQSFPRNECGAGSRNECGEQSIKNTESVFLTEWYDCLSTISLDEDLMNYAYWEKIRAVRDAVNKEIENQRNEGKLGSALEAEVYLYCAPHICKELKALEDELRFVLITSFAKVVPEHAGPTDAIVTDVPGLSIKVNPTLHPKCERCWHRCEDVDQNPSYKGLCARCIENVYGKGEIRKYA